MTLTNRCLYLSPILLQVQQAWDRHDRKDLEADVHEKMFKRLFYAHELADTGMKEIQREKEAVARGKTGGAAKRKKQSGGCCAGKPQERTTKYDSFLHEQIARVKQTPDYKIADLKYMKQRAS